MCGGLSLRSRILMTSHENQQYCKVNERYPDERFLSEVAVIDCDRP